MSGATVCPGNETATPAKEAFKLSGDPYFVDKVRHFSGRHLSPPHRAPALSTGARVAMAEVRHLCQDPRHRIGPRQFSDAAKVSLGAMNDPSIRPMLPSPSSK